jgi:hypothetical protein
MVRDGGNNDAARKSKSRAARDRHATGQATRVVWAPVSDGDRAISGSIERSRELARSCKRMSRAYETHDRRERMLCVPAMLRVLAVVLLVTGCRHSSFDDCTIACTAASGCPSGFSCGREGFCRGELGAGSCADVLADAGATDGTVPVVDAPIDATASTFCTDPMLRACYRFDEGAGAVLHDGTTNHNDGAITGATWGTGHTGGALSFDGALTTQVAIPDVASLRITGSLTLEAWIRPTVVGTDPLWDRLIDRGVNTGYGMGLGGGTASLCLRIMTTFSDLECSTAVISTGRWTHVAGTYNGTAMTVYVDGVASGTLAKSGAMATPALTTLLGNRAEEPSTTSYPYSGLLDDVRIYARAKGADEICQAAGRTWTGTACN